MLNFPAFQRSLTECRPDSGDQEQTIVAAKPNPAVLEKLFSTHHQNCWGRYHILLMKAMKIMKKMVDL